MFEGERRRHPDAWRLHGLSIATQLGLMILGFVLVVLGILQLDSSLTTAVVMMVVGAALLVMARPWLLIPRSYAPLAGGGLDGAAGRIIQRRYGANLVVTAEGIEHTHEGERTLLRWQEISAVEPISRGGVALALPYVGGTAQRLGFTPHQNLIRIRDIDGHRAAEWNIRSFIADPVEVLELLKHHHGEAVARS